MTNMPKLANYRLPTDLNPQRLSQPTNDLQFVNNIFKSTRHNLIVNLVKLFVKLYRVEEVYHCFLFLFLIKAQGS